MLEPAEKDDTEDEEILLIEDEKSENPETIDLDSFQDKEEIITE